MPQHINIAPRDLPTVFDSMANVLAETMGSEHMQATVLDFALQWLAKKQAQFSGAAYVDQLEKNSVYFRESAVVCDFATAEYLHDGKPLLQLDQVRQFVNNQKALSQATTRDHLKFVREGCGQCGSHWRHPQWQWMKDMRARQDHWAYLELLEYSSIVYCANYTTSEQFLLAFLQNRQLAGAARNAAMKDVWNVADDRSLIWASIWSNTLKLNAQMKWDDKLAEWHFTPEPVPSKRPHWREIWGERFDAIARNLD